MKTCTKCGLLKVISEFYASKFGKDGLRGDCKDCHKKQVTTKSSANRTMHNDNRLRTRYGITREQYDDLLKKQKGTCAICLKKPGIRSLAVDHDHACCPGNRSCGKCVRGLLCGNCNMALGLMKDNKANLLRMINYV